MDTEVRRWTGLYLRVLGVLVVNSLMHFPILTSLIALPMAGALLLLFVRDDEQNERADRAKIALVVSLLVFAETLLLWSRFDPASGRLPVRRAPRLDPGVRHRATSSASTASACCCSCSPAS